MNKAQRNIDIIMLFLFSAYAIYGVLYQNASIFFIIYLFWFDELIRNISAYIQVKMHVEELKLNREFSKQRAISNVKTRFFFLFVYAVFIVIVFGLFFNLNKENSEQLVQNVSIFFFRDITFNVCIMISMLREILQIRWTRLNRYAPIKPFNAMSGHLFTLHLSIILGGFLWAATSGNFKEFHLDLGSFNKYAIILPFFIIKFSVDLYAITHQKSAQSLLDNLQ
jgi:hypothetical protein